MRTQALSSEAPSVASTHREAVGGLRPLHHIHQQPQPLIAAGAGHAAGLQPYAKAWLSPLTNLALTQRSPSGTTKGHHTMQQDTEAWPILTGTSLTWADQSRRYRRAVAPCVPAAREHRCRGVQDVAGNLLDGIKMKQIRHWPVFSGHASHTERSAMAPCPHPQPSPVLTASECDTNTSVSPAGLKVGLRQLSRSGTRRAAGELPNCSDLHDSRAVGRDQPRSRGRVLATTANAGVETHSSRPMSFIYAHYQNHEHVSSPVCPARHADVVHMGTAVVAEHHTQLAGR